MESTIILKDALKKFTRDQDKVMLPEETIKNFRKKARESGLSILKETRRIDNGRLDIPVYFSVCGNDARQLTGTNKQMGKGATPDQAEASAVMELAERFSFFSFTGNPDHFITSSRKKLTEKSISFDLIAKSVHDESEDLETLRKIFNSLPLKWTKGYNLTRNEEVLVPFNWFFMINEFNGASAGNCQEEAIIQGISEIIERHVSSIISHEKLKVPLINSSSITDPVVKEMLKKYEDEGVKVYMSDFSLETGIPTAGVMAYDPSTFPTTSELVWTAGTTSDPQKAISRALTETAQLAGDFNTGSNYVASGLPKYSHLEDADYIMNPASTIDIKDIPDLSDDNIKVEIEKMLAVLKEKEMEVILINTTHPELNIPAFYTIIPGAHFRERSLGTSVGMFTAKMITENDHPVIAIKNLKEMDNVLPGKYYIKFYLGTSNISMGLPEIAMEYLKEALTLDPQEQDIPSIYSYIGICLRDMQLYEEALSMLEKGNDLDCERTDIHNLMGFCNFKLGRHEEAINCFRNVLSLDPGSAIDYANIASNYRELGNMDKAVTYYKMALEIDPAIEFAKDNLEKITGLN